MSEDFEARATRMRRWVLAFCIGILLHVGGIYAALYKAPELEEDDEMAGPIAIELAPMPVSNMAEDLDLPVGPRAEESAASVATPKQEAEAAKQEDVPPLDSTPYEPEDPDLKFSKQVKKEEEEKPEKEKTTEKVEMEQTATSTPIPESTAPPPSPSPEAKTSAAPQTGLDRTQKLALERWQRQIVVHLNKFKRYPADARSARREGDVVLAFTIDRDGHVVRRNIAGRSGSSSLDDAALSMLERAEPLPPPPKAVAGGSFDLSLPIEYRVKK